MVDGEEMPITKVRNLYFHPEEEVRKKAYEAELKAWEAHEVPLAFALNGVKGEASVLNRRRGYRDDLEPTLHENRITRKALKAMQEAVGESLPLFRRYFLLKARALGKERLDWWDLFAPLGRGRRWSLEEARAFIPAKLAALVPNAAKVAEMAFHERWMDLLPRKGKVGGAYCMARGGGKSLILANYEESFESVSTLAHELGHAYHNFALKEAPASLRRVPMTLAETASIMNETLVVEAALKEASPRRASSSWTPTSRGRPRWWWTSIAASSLSPGSSKGARRGSFPQGSSRSSCSRPRRRPTGRPSPPATPTCGR